MNTPTPNDDVMKDAYITSATEAGIDNTEAAAMWSRWLAMHDANILKNAAEKLSFNVTDVFGDKFPAVSTEELLDHADEIARTVNAAH